MFRSSWLKLLGPGPQLQGVSILLKFLLETRLKSEFFEPLINFVRVSGAEVWVK